MTSPMGLFRDNTKKLQTDVIDKHSVSKSELEGGRPVGYCTKISQEVKLGANENIQLTVRWRA